MIGRRSWNLRYVPLMGLVGAALVASLVPGMAVADESPQADVPEWALDDGSAGPVGLSAQSSLPSSYDLRDDGLVTPVKQKGPFGACWSFGGIAAAETSILSSVGTTYQQTAKDGSPLDLSERHLAYFALHPVTASIDPAQAGEGFHLKEDSPNAAFQAGGSGIFITTLFSQGVGPVLETQFPYRGKNAITSLDEFNADPDAAVDRQLRLEAGSKKMTYEQYLAYLSEATGGKSTEEILALYKDVLGKSAKDDMTYGSTDDWSIPETDPAGTSNRQYSAGLVLKNGNVLPDYWEDREADESPDADAMRCIKQELLNGRGVFLTYCADSTGAYTMSDPGSANMYNQCITKPLNPDHGVCIVGWDDSYAAENFNEGARPAGNGAWIVKNSWAPRPTANPTSWATS